MDTAIVKPKRGSISDIFLYIYHVFFYLDYSHFDRQTVFFGGILKDQKGN